MTQCVIKKSNAESKDIELINAFTRRALAPNEVYTFNVTLCNNDVDRDYEKFSLDALNQLANLFVGKTGIFDHSMRSTDQRARIYDAYVEKQEGKLTADGEQLYCLKAKVYMLNNDTNKALIDEIDAGIKKEVSISCSMGSSVCSICGNDNRNGRCEHIAGKTYGDKLCFNILKNASDAYEFSFVAVPAQRDAGVTKSFIPQGDNMQDILKTIKNCNDSITITKSQATQLENYIDNLSDDAKLGNEYKKQLSKDVVKLFAGNFPNIDMQLLNSVTAVMTAKELIGFKQGMQQKQASVKPQLAPANDKTKKQDYSQFKI